MTSEIATLPTPQRCRMMLLDSHLCFLRVDWHDSRLKCGTRLARDLLDRAICFAVRSGLWAVIFLVQLVCRGAGRSLRFSPRELSSCTACLRVSRLFGRYWVLTSLTTIVNGTCYLCPCGRVTPHSVRHRRALPLGLCSKINFWIPKWTKW